MPSGFFEQAPDWSGLAVTRLLAEPLFLEAPARGLRPNLVGDCRRVGALSWKVTLNGGARWNNGDRIDAAEICRQIVRARNAGAASLPAALMIKSMTAVSSETVRLETRFPVAHLDRVLANPGLAPRHSTPGITAGPYTLGRCSKQGLHLMPARSGRPLELIGSSPIEDHDQFDLGLVHVSGPMSTKPRDWVAVSGSETSTLFPLDIVYVLILPEWLPSHGRALFNAGVDRARICRPSNGCVVPCGRMTSLWSENQPGAPEISPGALSGFSTSGRAELFCTAFPANREIAVSAARELLDRFNLRVKISLQDYREFITGSPEKYRNAFRLALVASPWPHPVAMLAPFFFGGGSSDSFRTLFMEAAEAEDIESASGLAARAEEALIGAGSRVVTLGRVVGCLRSHVGAPWCPPSGWIDYSALTDP